MRTNIVLDDALVAEAQRLSRIKTKRQLIDQALREFVANRKRSELDSDRMLLFALVRAIEIIGEAASKVSEDTRAAHDQIPWKAIVGMRNRLVHAYFEVDTQVLWETVTREVPGLLPQLREIVSNPDVRRA